MKVLSFSVWQLRISHVSIATFHCYSNAIDLELPSNRAEEFHLWYFSIISFVAFFKSFFNSIINFNKQDDLGRTKHIKSF